MSKASEEKLSDLHGMLATVLLSAIKGGEATAAVLNTARQFLKDNGIECDGAQNPILREMTEEIPDFVGQDTFQ